MELQQSAYLTVELGSSVPSKLTLLKSWQKVDSMTYSLFRELSNGIKNVCATNCSQRNIHSYRSSVSMVFGLRLSNALDLQDKLVKMV